MKLAWHIAKKDLRRLRVHIALFALTIILKIVIGVLLVRRSAPTEGTWFQLIDLYANLAIGLEIVIGYILAAAIVHEDQLVGTRAFWMTKPLSGQQLWGGKLLALIVVFGVMPIVLTIGWWLGCGFGPREILHAAIGTLFWQALITAISVTVAALTPNFSRFIACSFTSLLLAGFCFVMRAARLWSVWGEFHSRSPGAAYTAVALSFLLLFTGLTIIVLHQYRTRRLWRSVIILSVVILVAFAPIPWWRSDLLSRFGPAPSVEASAVNVRVAAVEMKTSADRNTKAQLSGRFEYIGVPSPRFLAPSIAEVELRWPDGLVTERRPHALIFHNRIPEVYLLLNLRPPTLIPIATGKGWSQGSLLHAGYHEFVAGSELMPSIAARIAHDSPQYTANVSADLLEPFIIGDAPLVAGNSLGQGIHQLRILSTSKRDHGLLVELVEHIAPSDDHDAGPWSFRTSYSTAAATWGFVAVNRSHPDVQLRWANLDFYHELRIAGVVILRRRMEFLTGPDEFGGTGNTSIEPDWFDHAQLVRLGFRRIASLKRQVRLEQPEKFTTTQAVSRRP